jgi:type IX secretion system PorP/SprF family membrane protein
VKFYLLNIILFLLSSKVNSQIKASQFYLTPLLYNPASTGRFDKGYRLGLSFRNEVNGQQRDFKQSIFSFDTKIFKSKLPENDCLAIGVVGMSENGINEGIKNSYLSLSIGYQKALSEDGKQQIGIGFQNTFARKTITKPALIFEDDLFKYLNYGYTNIDIFQFGNVDLSFNDVNAGLIFQGAINSTSTYSIGVSAYHITSPQILFIGGTYNLPRQFFSHFSFEKEYQNTSKLYTSCLIGLTYNLKIKKYKSILFGGFFRKNQIYGNAIIPNLGLNFIDFTVNFSYDVNVSSVVRQKGASEASLKYTIARSKAQFLEKRFIEF